MSDCVLHAYFCHVKHIFPGAYRPAIRSHDVTAYDVTKRLTHDERYGPTLGCMVPLIVQQMGLNLSLLVIVQHRLHTPAMYLRSAENDVQRALIRPEDFGEYADPLTLEPAIYLLNADNHAVFAETVPDYGVPVMALQLRKEMDDDSHS